MEDTLVSYKVAVLAKAKGFDIPTSKYYLSDNSLNTKFEDSQGSEREYYFEADDFTENWNKKGWVSDKKGGICFGCKLDNINYFEAYSAPTQSLLQKWLREVPKVHIFIDTIINEKDILEGFQGCVHSTSKQKIEWMLEKIAGDTKKSETFEEELEKLLEEALNRLPDGNK